MKTEALNPERTEMKVKTMIRLVCSNRPRPQVQSSHAKWGGGSWSRDTHHATLKLTDPLYEGGARTLCGRDCSDWLTIENNVDSAEAVKGGDLCKRCAAKLALRH